VKVGYARTSTLEQKAGCEAQVRELETAGCERVCREQVSSLGDRQELAAALDYIREGDILVVSKLDRLARSVAHLVEITTPHEASEPPVDRPARRKVIRQHPPPATRSNQIPDRVQDLAQINVPRPASLGRSRQHRFDPRPFLIGEIGRIALRLPLDRGHTASSRWRPHDGRESPIRSDANIFQTVSQRLPGGGHGVMSDGDSGLMPLAPMGPSESGTPRTAPTSDAPGPSRQCEF
jgi:hypothetical protein